MSVRQGSNIVAGSVLVDATPTQDSTNAVSSGGVYTGLAGKVNKSGDTMTGNLRISGTNRLLLGNTGSEIKLSCNSGSQVMELSYGSQATGLRLGGTSIYSSGSLSVGRSNAPLANVFTPKLNNGADVTVPTTSGTLALTSDVVTNISGLSDVTIISATSGQVLEYDGSKWVNTTQTHHGNDITTGTTYYGTISQGGSQYGTVVFDSTVNIVKGDILVVKWNINQSTANNLKMNTLSSTSIPLMHKGSQIAANTLVSGDVMEVVYDGTYFQLMSVNKWAVNTSNMMTTNTAQSVSAIKTFTAASPDATTSQTIVANYAIKFGTSANDDLFAISANTNTSTLNIVGDNANNTICLAASGAVLNKLEITQSDVTFGGTSLINPGVMTGASSVDNGTSGLVPAPSAGDQQKFLQGDGTWANPTAAVAWGNITGTLSNQTDLQNALDNIDCGTLS